MRKGRGEGRKSRDEGRGARGEPSPHLLRYDVPEGGAAVFERPAALSPLVPRPSSRLAASAAAAIRAAIRLAGGREVCFVAQLDDEGTVQTARVVARGDVRSVLALPGAAQRGEMLLHNHPSGNLEPSGADLEVALRLHDGGIGFGIVDNDARELYVVVEVPREREAARVDAEDVSGALGPGGPIAAKLPRYEDRPSQRALARAIATRYNEHGIGLFEAGTGVGKSLGYLVPALRWAHASGERTIVSTNTINLQEQLVGKDLPFLQRTLDDQPVRFALLKGWRNYLCLHRLEQASDLESGLFEEGVAADIAALRGWAERTTDGSLSDLPSPPRPDVWDEVSAEPDLCGRMKCAHFEKCFLFAARRRAAQADVIVVNHHLLLSDLAVRRAQGNWGDAAVLPAYKRLVVDEGHHLEDAAAQHLGTSVTRRGLQRLLGRLDRKGKGLLHALAQRLAREDDLLSTASLDLVHARLFPAVHAAREKGAQLFDLLDTLLAERAEQVMRLDEGFASHPIWGAGLDIALTDLLGEIGMLHEGLRLVRERLETDERRREAVQPLLDEIRGVARRLDTAAGGLTRALRPPPDEEPSVRWVEVRGRERNVAATSVPLDIAPILREDLWKRVDTAIVTSATLATEERFDFLASRLGLDEPDVQPAAEAFPSPFDYRRQAVLAIPTDVPAPNADVGRHLQAVVRVALDVATAADGGVFVLFTSHRDVRAAATELRARGVERRWPLLVHGDDSRDTLLRRFRESGRAVLLGTASFWEGVDVPGRALRGLVIARLPFRVPTEPLTAANCEAIEARGGDSFAEYMLPHATLRLKQGFGRLIRSGTDRGVVVLCDPRVLTKGYGRRVLAALPPARRATGPWRALLPDIERFYRDQPEDQSE
ncbi:MAG TPA: helicase C-terminal domain-containing protein [Gemmatimonadaceae bacterium]|nr:helicase C-terminal domain-containing protein [Gemmatimonadaceae bacterium]